MDIFVTVQTLSDKNKIRNAQTTNKGSAIKCGGKHSHFHPKIHCAPLWLTMVKHPKCGH